MTKLSREKNNNSAGKNGIKVKRNKIPICKIYSKLTYGNQNLVVPKLSFSHLL